MFKIIPMLAREIKRLLPPYDRNGNVTPLTSFLVNKNDGCKFFGKQKFLKKITLNMMLILET